MAQVSHSSDKSLSSSPGEVDLVDRRRIDPGAERRSLIDGLRATPGRIPPKYFYDALGAALYSAICELPEYYPTRTERSIFETHRAEIAEAIGRGTQFVDLGTGDGAKAALWLASIEPSRYIAVDIAAQSVRAALARIAVAFPDIAMTGVVADFTQGLDLHRDLGPGPATFFYPGSSIGNFAPPEASAFLADIHRHCAARGGGLLIGVDTPKDTMRLQAAYDDALGVTAAFNRNILLHVNRVLGCDFDAAAFRHVALFDRERSRIEMHLEATHAVTVNIDGVPRRFDVGERIHTENSYKYAPAAFTAMLNGAGFETVTRWQDAAGDFAVYYAA